MARLSRAEAYTALKQYQLALEDTEFCCGTELSAEVGRSHKFALVSHKSLVDKCSVELIMAIGQTLSNITTALRPVTVLPLKEWWCCQVVS